MTPFVRSVQGCGSKNESRVDIDDIETAANMNQGIEALMNRVAGDSTEGSVGSLSRRLSSPHHYGATDELEALNVENTRLLAGSPASS